MSSILNGIDSLIHHPKPSLKKMSWGLVTNDAARLVSGKPSRKALVDHKWKIKCLFSPEHGLSAKGVDGEAQENQHDASTNLVVYSLYGPTFGPSLKKMQNIDGVIFDLPDIGLRFYTYVWTLSYLMEACQEAQKPLVILDRLNPLSGNLDLAEGPFLDEKNLSTFIGRWNIPIRHSLTLGELAKYWKHERAFKDLDLIIIPVEGWKRKQYFSDSGLPFYPPSPAINFPETLLTYPALCFMEGLNLNEGRGTGFPFQQFGAPWIKALDLADSLNDLQIPGTDFKPVDFKPGSNRYSGLECHGVRLMVQDRELYRPIHTGLTLLAWLKIIFPEKISLARYPTHANPTGERHLEYLIGDTEVFYLLMNDPGLYLEDLTKLTSAVGWGEKVGPFLIYG